MYAHNAVTVPHLYFGSFSHSSIQILSSSARLDGERCSTAIFRSLQRCFNQVRALAGPLKDIQRLVLKTLLHCLGCGFRVVVLLEGEPSPQSEVPSTLEQVLIKDLSVIFSLNLSLDPDSQSLPAEKHLHSMMLPPTCFSVGMVPSFLQT